MEMLLFPICLIVGGYIVVRLVGIDVKAILEEWKEIFGILMLVVLLLGLAGAFTTGIITPEELDDRTGAMIELGGTLIADHLTGIAIGAVATPIAVFLIAILVRPIMDAFDL